MMDVFTGGAFQTNGYLLRFSGAGAVLVDAPEGVAGWLESRGQSIDTLLLTHLHYDHVVDVAALKRDHGCAVYAHSAPDPDLTLETVLKEVMGLPIEIGPFEVDRFLAGESEIEISASGITLGLHPVPGHSPDSLCFGPFDHEDLEGSPVLFGGDVLFRGGIGRTDFPHGNHAQLISGIREIVFAFPDETRVLPGHGPPTTVGLEKAANPFLQEF